MNKLYTFIQIILKYNISFSLLSIAHKHFLGFLLSKINYKVQKQKKTKYEHNANNILKEQNLNFPAITKKMHKN